MTATNLFDECGWFVGDLPDDCVADCSASGDVTALVYLWLDRLSFVVPRPKAIAYLKEFGAWPVESDKYDKGLNDMTDTELAAKVLWIACGDISEQGEWLGLVH
jgi:hypothetical protein